ncbi:aromatic amino acid transport family protein [Thermococcus sp. MV5]|uniref:aromatic amino acid transport family protein n=1 Tax=Thermococcus sp. MV5 TaxID=1638272 RepID=UPI003211F227
MALSRNEALALAIGTQVGAGVLGLPYAARKIGLIPSVALMFLVASIMYITALFVLELSAKNGGKQMSTLAREILGRPGGVLMFASISLMSYGALLAYIAGGGSVFANLFGISEEMGALVFWAFASFIIYRGLEMSGKSELILSGVLLALFVVVAIMAIPHTKVENAFYMGSEGIVTLFGVAIFAFGCHTIVPDIYKGLRSYEEAKKVLLLAFLVPAIVYSLFVASFLLVFGENTPQIATQALEQLYGRIGMLVGSLIPIFAILTSYIGLGLAQLDNMEEYLKMNRKSAWIITVFPPLILYMVGIRDFVEVLGAAGSTGDLMAFIIMPIVLYITYKLKPEFLRDREAEVS